ncbi:MAG: hypothetical protein CSB49_03240 [Proteobacteria bacterium]|nr:MAG: hypothetical protein CSB49_03240 [Pseudomonadota bacterium]
MATGTNVNDRRSWTPLASLLVILVVGSASGCRCGGSTGESELRVEGGERMARPTRPDESRRARRRRAVGRRGSRQLAARFSHRPTLFVGERLKCARMRERLVAAGAQVRLPTTFRLPALKSDTALISFVQHRRKLYRFVRWRGRTRRLRALPLANVDPLLIGLRDELEFGKLDMRTLQVYLGRAYDRLLADAVPPKAKRLLFAPDGLARFVPLHALLARASGSRGATARQFVVSRAAIAYLPCAALAVGSSRPLSTLTLIAPSYGRGRARKPLAGAHEELKAIMKQARRLGLPAARYVGTEATPKRLLAALEARGRLVHFAGHGLADLRPGSPPELIFPGRDEGLSVQLLTRSPARASMAVLASCAGAYVARFRDDQRLLAKVNLAEALLGAGTGTVIAASWSVKDRQSAAQMRLFYRDLQRLGAARALAAAQRERIARLRPPHPRFWAFYAVYGDPGW